MAYQIAATTEPDRDLLDEIRDLAYREGREVTVSEVIRRAFRAEIKRAEKAVKP